MNEKLGDYGQVRRLPDKGRVYAAVSASGTPCRLQRLSMDGVAEAEREQVLETVRRDVATVASLQEPCIAAFREVFCDGDDLVVVSAPYDGVGLDAFLVDARGEVDAPTAWHVLHAVARALNQAHCASDAAGDLHAICHGHVSPSHIRLASDGRVAVAGLGLASMVGSSELVAEVAYQAPEQRDGARITPRGDIYSIASLAWMMLCGRPPGHPADFDELSGKLPDSLRDCFFRSLQASPALRRMTTMDFEHQLADVVQPVGKQHLAVAVAALEARASLTGSAAVDDDLDSAATMMFGSDDDATAIVEDASTMPRNPRPRNAPSTGALPPLRSKLPTLRGGTDAVMNASGQDAEDDEDLESTVVMDVARLKEAAAAATRDYEDKGPPSSELNWGDDSFQSTIALGGEDSHEAPLLGTQNRFGTTDELNEDSIRLEIPPEALNAPLPGPESDGELSWSSDDGTEVLANDVAQAFDDLQSEPLPEAKEEATADEASTFASDATVAMADEGGESPLDDPRVLPRRGPESAPPLARSLPRPRGSRPDRDADAATEHAAPEQRRPQAVVTPSEPPPLAVQEAELLPSLEAKKDEPAEAVFERALPLEPASDEASLPPSLAAVGAMDSPASAASPTQGASASPSSSTGPAVAQPAKVAGSPWGTEQEAKKDKPISLLTSVALILFAMVVTLGAHVAYTVYSNDTSMPEAPPPVVAAKPGTKSPIKTGSSKTQTAKRPIAARPSALASTKSPSKARAAGSAEPSAAPVASVAAETSAKAAASAALPPPVAAAPTAPPAAPPEKGPAATGKGSDLPPDQGYLEVLFNGEHGGIVFFKRKMMGPVGQAIKVPCKDPHWVRIGKMPGPRWLSKGTTIRVKCQGLTKKFVSPR
jgi:hypothetical protein